MQERFKNFTVLIAKINRCIRKIKTEEMAEFDLKSTHVSCLYYLYTMETLTSKELCDVCEEDKASISRSIWMLKKRKRTFSCGTSLWKKEKVFLKAETSVS